MYQAGNLFNGFWLFQRKMSKGEPNPGLSLAGPSGSGISVSPSSRGKRKLKAEFRRKFNTMDKRQRLEKGTRFTRMPWNIRNGSVIKYLDQEDKDFCLQYTFEIGPNPTYSDPLQAYKHVISGRQLPVIQKDWEELMSLIEAVHECFFFDEKTNQWTQKVMPDEDEEDSPVSVFSTVESESSVESVVFAKPQRGKTPSSDQIDELSELIYNAFDSMFHDHEGKNFMAAFLRKICTIRTLWEKSMMEVIGKEGFKNAVQFESSSHIEGKYTDVVWRLKSYPIPMLLVEVKSGHVYYESDKQQLLKQMIGALSRARRVHGLLINATSACLILMSRSVTSKIIYCHELASYNFIDDGKNFKRMTEDLEHSLIWNYHMCNDIVDVDHKKRPKSVIAKVDK